MVHPKDFEQKIGFNRIREMIGEHCISSLGEYYARKIRFSSDRGHILRLLKQTSEFQLILFSGNTFPTQNFFDLRPELARIKTKGTVIGQADLFDLTSSLKTIRTILGFFSDSAADAYPMLKELADEVDFPRELLVAAEKIIDERGEIRDNASEELDRIRKQLAEKEKKVISAANKAFKLAKKSGWTSGDSELSIRNGRPVIPLKANDKRALGGIIHDESASGQTVFVEPAESFELNNQIRELENEERREIHRILLHFTDRLRPFTRELTGAYRMLGLIDFIRAKALTANIMHAEQPTLNNKNRLSMKQAIHPLLFMAHQKAGKEVVPLSLELDPANRILVISGPNAGGKSVCLKTIGLLQYMLQCGLHVPCSPDSSFPVFKKIFIDIGDEQSIENDLSTYSSHLLNMKYFLRHAGDDTLFLIDEFGTGTEPQLGGAIAESTLEQLNRKMAFGVVTTHYSNLKLVAQRKPGIFNGAMLFDSKAMQPLYQLKTGNPGSSFTFEIARKIGFPKAVLQKAVKKSGGKHVSFDKQLQQMEIDKISIEKKKKEVAATDEYLSEMVEKYTNLMEEVKKTKKQIISQAREEALKIVEESNKAVEKTIKEIKEAGAEREKTRQLRKSLEDKKQELSAEPAEKPKKKTGKKSNQKQKKEADETLLLEQTDPLTAGDFVRIKNTDIIGELIELGESDAILNVNDIRLKTSVAKLVRTNQRPVSRLRMNVSGRNRSIMNEINQKAANFELAIDLRGNRVEEALPRLQKYIDEAILLSISEVSILHGKGDGILRPVVREFLAGISEVKEFGDAPLDRGGAGITRVIFK